MKKIILSFALFFALLFINSCKEDDTVSPDSNSPKMKSWTEVSTRGSNTDTNTLSFEYKDNNISKVSIKEAEVSGEVYFTYESGKIKSHTSTIFQDGKSVTNLTEFKYSNNLLKEVISYTNGQKSSKTIYNYSGNKLIEVIRSSYDGILTIDSTYCTDFVEGRPGLVESFRSYDLNPLRLMDAEKFIYKNGNLIEKYEKWSENENFHLALKKNYDLTKKSLFNYFKEVLLLMNSKYPYIPNNIDVNLETKNDYYTNYCNSVKYEDGVLYSSNPINYTYNSKGLVEKLTSDEILYCDQNNATKMKVSFVWE